MVIQGPIQSIGRTMKDLSPRDHDSSENCLDLIRRIHEWGATPILITWDNQELKNLSDLNSTDIHKITFPEFPIIRRFKNNYYKNSKYRQFYSTAVGSEILRSKGIESILKIRTDQGIEIEKLLNAVVGIYPSISKGRIFTPLMNSDKPNMFYDFYYYSDTQTMIDFNWAMMLQKELCTNVHYDAFYNWHFSKPENRKEKKLGLIYPQHPRYTQKQLDLIEKIWDESFAVLPQAIWAQLNWRGEPFDESAVKHTFIYSDSTMTISEYFRSLNDKVKPKVSIDWISLPSLVITSRVEDSIRRMATKMSSVRFHSRRILRSLTRKFITLFR